MVPTTDDEMIYIIAGAAAGAVLLIVMVIIIACVVRRRKQSDSIYGRRTDEDGERAGYSSSPLNKGRKDTQLRYTSLQPEQAVEIEPSSHCE